VIETVAGVLDVWRRRWWRGDAAHLAAAAHRQPNLQPVVLITGGSEGIGLALAKRFAADKHTLLLVARDASKLSRAAAALSPSTRVLTLSQDVTATDTLATIDALCAREKLYIDVLINAAGVGAAGAFADQDEKTLARLIALNVAALTALTRHVLPGMLARGRGGILNVASLGAYAPGPYQSAYYASKSYVTALTEAIASETSGQGVRISTLLPGPVATEFHHRMGSQSALYLQVLPVQSADTVARSAMWRFRLGQRVIIPGLFNPLLALAMRVLPHRLLLPVIGFLLKPRG
jgi:uncharacterized protein